MRVESRFEGRRIIAEEWSSCPRKGEAMNCLITGATGEVGLRVTRLLLERGVRPRVFTRDSDKAHALFAGRVDVSVGDIALAATLRTALQGADTLFLVNVGPEIPERDRVAAELAREAGIRKIVKLSSLDVEQGLAIGAWHEQGETAIRSARIPHVFVRPTGFMSNFLAWAPSIEAEGIVRSSTGNGRRPFIHPDDIAAVRRSHRYRARHHRPGLTDVWRNHKSHWTGNRQEPFLPGDLRRTGQGPVFANQWLRGRDRGSCSFVARHPRRTSRRHDGRRGAGFGQKAAFDRALGQRKCRGFPEPGTVTD